MKTTNEADVMTRPVLILLGPETAAAAAEAGVGGAAEIVVVPAEPDAVRRALERATVLLDASMKVRIDAAMIAAAPMLRVVTTATTGADHIDAGALAARGIPLLTLAGQRDVLSRLTAAAEHSWLLLMACARQLRGAVDHVMAGGWNRVEFPGVMLRGRTLGLIGCGRIGRCMARYARAFDMRVIGHDPLVEPWPDGIEPVDLPELFASADFVSVHVPLNDATRGLVSAALLARARGAVLINTSRGEIIDEAALLAALEDGRLAAAGLDVLTGEPDVVAHPLRVYATAHANVVITPHIGGFSPDAVAVAVEFAARRGMAALEGRA